MRTRVVSRFAVGIIAVGIAALAGCAGDDSLTEPAGGSSGTGNNGGNDTAGGTTGNMGTTGAGGGSRTTGSGTGGQGGGGGTQIGGHGGGAVSGNGGSGNGGSGNGGNGGSGNLSGSGGTSDAAGGQTGSGGTMNMGTGGSGGMGGAGGVVCTSNKTWTGGNGPDMRPGNACQSCHSFSIAGTVYPTAHEPNNCDGTSGSTGVQVVITESNGTKLTLTPGTSGDFYSQAQIKTPFTVTLTRGGNTRKMMASQTSGNCNSCHTQDGANGAPGRIMSP